MRTTKKHRGTSLVECVLSIALTGIVIAGIIALVAFVNKNRMAWKEYDRLGNLCVTITSQVAEDIRNGESVEDSEKYDIKNVYEDLKERQAEDENATIEPGMYDEIAYTTNAKVSVVKCKAYGKDLYRVVIKIDGQYNTHLLVTNFLGGDET